MSMMMAVAEPAELKKFSGMQRAAALMLALGKEHGAPIWTQLTVEEIKDLSSCIAQLGRGSGSGTSLVPHWRQKVSPPSRGELHVGQSATAS